LNLLNIKIKLPLKTTEEMTEVYASVPLSLFYIDQDTSWSGALYKRTLNLNYYASNSIPKGIFEYLLKISIDEIIELQDKKLALQKQSSTLKNKCDVLVDLKDKFTLDVPSVVFDESLAKEEIFQYLKLADELGQKIKKYKANIYSKRIQLDALLLDRQELDEILKYLKKSYKNIEHTCTQCNSYLTAEQSIQRMKLDNNQTSAHIYALDLEKKIETLQESIKAEEGKKLNLEDDYTKLLSIAETKRGDLTLGQHIEDRAKENTKNIYCNVRNDLSDEIDRIAKVIEELTRNIGLLSKGSKGRKQEIEKYFETLLLKLKIIFPKANLDRYKFLDFKEIKDSGSIKNEVFLCLYMAYSNLLLKYSSVQLPFVFDSPIKDEIDKDNIKKFYQLIEDTLLTSEQQTICVMLEDKLPHIKGSYNKIALDGNNRLLNKEKFEELKLEFCQMIEGARKSTN
jgi:hypothetical protein